MKTKGIDGKKFGKLTVLAFVGIKNEHAMWRCLCDCGVERIVYGHNLRSGRTTTCGCALGCEGGSQPRITRTKRGGFKHPLYQRYHAMIQRCINPFQPGYRNYGARGISVCERWINSFPNFVSDMGMPPSAGMSVDRQNNDGNYEPSNCRWATAKQQGRNTRRLKMLTIDGETLCLAEWEERCGTKRNHVRSLVRKLALATTTNN